MNPPHSGWAAELAARARRSLAVTVIGTTAMSGLFFVGYFYVQSHPLTPPHQMPLTRWDLLIGVQPTFLIAYLSLWLYLGAGPGLQPTPRAIVEYAQWIGALGIVGLLIFWIWPTQIPTFSFANDLPAISLLHRADKTGNACPSMHVASAIFTALRVDDVFRTTRTPLYMRLVNLLWVAAIVYSTLAIRQHVVWDVIAGAALGAAFALASLTTRGRRHAV